MQKEINNDVTDAVDTFDYIWQSALSLWDSFPVELKVFFLTIFVISVLMEWVKKALLTGKVKRERIRLLWLSSLPMGVILAGIGYYIGSGVIHIGYWAIIGLTAGTSAMGIHYVTMRAVLPIVMMVWGRVMLALRGHD